MKFVSSFLRDKADKQDLKKVLGIVIQRCRMDRQREIVTSWRHKRSYPPVGAKDTKTND